MASWYPRNGMIVAVLLVGATLLAGGCQVDKKEDPGSAANVVFSYQPTETVSYRESGDWLWSTVMNLEETGGLGATVTGGTHEFFNSPLESEPFFSHSIDTAKLVETFGGTVLPANSKLVGVWRFTRGSAKGFFVRTTFKGVDNNGGTWKVVAWFRAL